VGPAEALRVSKSRWAKSNIRTKEKHMKPKWPTSIFKVFHKLVPGSSFTVQDARLSSSPLSKNLACLRRLNTFGQKQYLARDVGEKMFNSTLIKKFIIME